MARLSASSPGHVGDVLNGRDGCWEAGVAEQGWVPKLEGGSSLTALLEHL